MKKNLKLTTVILGIVTISLFSFSGCTEKSDGSENTTKYEPTSSKSIVEMPSDGILSYLNSNVKNSIKGNLKDANKYSVSLNGDGFLLSGSALTTLENNEFYCESLFFPKDYLTVLAYKDDNIIAASFILLEQNTDTITGKVIKSFSFNKIDGDYQTVSANDIEKLRQDSFKDFYYMNATDMKKIIDATSETTDYNSTSLLSFNDKSFNDILNESQTLSINPIKINNKDIMKLQIESLNSSSFISDKKDAVKFDVLEYEVNALNDLYLLGDFSKNNKIGIKLLNNDGIVSFITLSINVEDGKINYNGSFMQNYEKLSGKYTNLNNNYFKELINR